MIVTRGAGRLDLTAKEIAILDLFLGAPGRDVPTIETLRGHGFRLDRPQSDEPH